MAKPPALGKGLGALITPRPASPGPALPASLTAPQPGERVLDLPITEIVSSPLQPRTEFRAEQLAELVESIRERGIIQPLIVRQVHGKYELIAGERRWRAAREVGLTHAPAIIRQASDVEVLELALVENLQREDLNPIEEAQAYARLSREFSMTQEEIARKVGKNRATVANAMRLIELDPEVQGYLRQNLLTVGHAKALLAIKSPEEQRLLAAQILRQGATVRAAEKLVQKFLENSGQAAKGRRKTASGEPISPPHLQRLENLLTHHLSTRVIIHHKEKVGTITLEYYGTEDLDRILQLLGVKVDN